MVRFVEYFLSFNQLNISRADIPCVLKNDDGEAARSTQPVTLYITVNITRFDPHQADESMKRIDGSNTWERAVRRIKWVMDTLGPIAEVRVMPFDVLERANFHTQLSPFAKMAHGLLLAIPKVRLFVSFSELDVHVMFV